LDGPRHHFWLTQEPGIDQVGVVGVLELEGGAGFGERSSGILLGVPGLGADGRQEMLHGGVAVEELAI